MTDHDPQDLEWWARAVCEAGGRDPDAVLYEMPEGRRPVLGWENNKQFAGQLLDHLAKTGAKVTRRDFVRGVGDGDTLWAIRHDAAPLTPRDET